MTRASQGLAASLAAAFLGVAVLLIAAPVLGQSPSPMASMPAGASLAPCPTPMASAPAMPPPASQPAAVPNMAPSGAAPCMTPAPSAGTATAGGAVTIKDFSFQPASLSVAVGSTVTWTNNDTTGHTVTADDGSFDSGTVAPGSTFSHTFATAGTFTYHCNIHPSMTATITVG